MSQGFPGGYEAPANAGDVGAILSWEDSLE